MPLILSEQRWLRFGAFCAFYFAQGVPIGLLTVAIPAWLAQEGATVGDLAWFTGFVSAPWGFKLVAGPFMDRFKFLPMGFRRPWVMAAQGGLALSFVALAATGDLGLDSLTPLMAIGFVINAFAATQDVAVDGMAIDILPEDERGRANAFMAAGQVAGFSAYGALCWDADSGGRSSRHRAGLRSYGSRHLRFGRRGSGAPGRAVTALDTGQGRRRGRR